jgi:hypothetical protein
MHRSREVTEMLHRNEGRLDRAIRIAAAILFVPIGLFVLDGVGGAIGGLVLAGAGVLALVTGTTGFCPLYLPFGVSTTGARETSAGGGRRAPVHV